MTNKIDKKIQTIIPHIFPKAIEQITQGKERLFSIRASLPKGLEMAH